MPQEGYGLTMILAVSIAMAFGTYLGMVIEEKRADVEKDKANDEIVANNSHVSIKATAAFRILQGLGKATLASLLEIADWDPRPDQLLLGAYRRLHNSSTVAVSPGVIQHSCEINANPISQTRHIASSSMFDKEDVLQTGIIDGQGGYSCAHWVAQTLPRLIHEELARQYLLSISATSIYPPLISSIKQTLEKCFDKLDEMVHMVGYLLNQGLQPEASSATMLQVASSGTSVLHMLWIKAQSTLWLAHLGNSRAVLGQWDSVANCYHAEPLTKEHDGHNLDEVERIQAQHPGERIFDPATGTMLGLPVTRSIGNARWKWSAQASEKVHSQYGLPPPLSGGTFSSPPYQLTEPEVSRLEVQSHAKTPFVILGNAAFWSKFTSEAAVRCVERWLEHYHVVEATKRFFSSAKKAAPYSSLEDEQQLHRLNPADIYYDKKSAAMNWDNTEEYWSFEQKDNCAAHLMQNALGGTRKSLFSILLTAVPPYSQSLYNDMCVTVVFLHQDTSTLPDHRRESIETGWEDH